MSEVEVDFSFNDWVLKVDITNKKRYKDRLRDERINLMESKGFVLKEQKYEYEGEVKSIDLNLLDQNLGIHFPYLKNLSLQRNNSNKNENAYPGVFTGKLYASDQSSSNLNSVKELLHEKGMVFRTIREIKSIWQASTGVYLFRNDFRLLPYGPEHDWLGLGRRSRKSKNNIYKPHAVSGYVNLDGESSENLQEQTNRLGLIMDEYGSNFIKIVENVVAELAFREDIRL